MAEAIARLRQSKVKHLFDMLHRDKKGSKQQPEQAPAAPPSSSCAQEAAQARGYNSAPTYISQPTYGSGSLNERRRQHGQRFDSEHEEIAPAFIRATQSAVERDACMSPAGARRGPGLPMRSPSGSYGGSSPSYGQVRVGGGSGPATPSGSLRAGSQRYGSPVGHPQGYGSPQATNYYHQQQEDGYSPANACQQGSHVLRTHSNLSGCGDQYYGGVPGGVLGVDMPACVMSAGNSPVMSPTGRGHLNGYTRTQSHPNVSPRAAAATHAPMQVPPGHIRTPSGRIRMYGPPEVMSPRRQGSGNYGPVVTTLSRFAATGNGLPPNQADDVYAHQYQNSAMAAEYGYQQGNGYGYQQGPSKGVSSPGTSRSSSLNGGWTSSTVSNSSSTYGHAPTANAPVAHGKMGSTFSRDINDDESDDGRPIAAARAVTYNKVAAKKPVHGGQRKLSRDLSSDGSDDDAWLQPVMKANTIGPTARAAPPAVAPIAASASSCGMQKNLSRDLSWDDSDDDGLQPVMKANTIGPRARAAAPPPAAAAASASGRGGKQTMMSRDLSDDDSENDGFTNHAAAAKRKALPSGSGRAMDRGHPQPQSRTRPQPQLQPQPGGHPRSKPQQRVARDISDNDSDMEPRAAAKQGGASRQQQPQQPRQQQHQQPRQPAAHQNPRQLSRSVSEDSSDEECSIAHPTPAPAGGNQGRLVCNFSDEDSDDGDFSGRGPVAAAARQAARPAPSSQLQQQQYQQQYQQQQQQQQYQQQYQQQQQSHRLARQVSDDDSDEEPRRNAYVGGDQQQRPAQQQRLAQRQPPPPQQQQQQQLQRRFSDDEEVDGCQPPSARQVSPPQKQQQQHHVPLQGNAGISGSATYPPHNQKPANSSKVVRCISDDESDGMSASQPKQAARPQGVRAKKPAQKKDSGKPKRTVRKTAGL